MTYKGYELKVGMITLTNGNKVSGIVIEKDGRRTMAQDRELAMRYVDMITKEKGEMNNG